MELLASFREASYPEREAAQVTLVNNIRPLGVGVKQYFGGVGPRIKIRHSDLNGAVFPNLVTALNELMCRSFLWCARSDSNTRPSGS